MRNIAAFINFACDPNLDVRKYASASGDKALPRIAFFARRDISRGEELGYKRDPCANVRQRNKQIACRCGALNCVREAGV